jgi:nicotinate-nucleotide adenylyltransferase
MGSDNLENIHKWKNFELLLERYKIHVYTREGSAIETLFETQTDIRIYDVPMMNISSTYIRQCIADGHSIRYLVPESVYLFLDGSHLYRQ